MTFVAEGGPIANGDLLAACWVARRSYAGGAQALHGFTAAPETHWSSTVPISSVSPTAGLPTTG